MRILISELNLELTRECRIQFEYNGFSVDISQDNEESYERIHRTEYDAVILSADTTTKNKKTTLENLREDGNNIPIILVSLNSSVKNIIQHLNSGADDFLSIPFDIDILIARVNLAIRKNKQEKNPTLKCANLHYDISKKIFSINKNYINLRPKENLILTELIKNKGVTYSKSRIFESIYQSHDINSLDLIDVYISRIRKKISNSGAEIRTIRGIGYFLDEKL